MCSFCLEGFCLSHSSHVCFTRVPMFMLWKNSAQSFWAFYSFLRMDYCWRVSSAADNEPFQENPFYSAGTIFFFFPFLFFISRNWDTWQLQARLGHQVCNSGLLLLFNDLIHIPNRIWCNLMNPTCSGFKIGIRHCPGAAGHVTRFLLESCSAAGTTLTCRLVWLWTADVTGWLVGWMETWVALTPPPHTIGLKGTFHFLTAWKRRIDVSSNPVPPAD